MDGRAKLVRFMYSLDFIIRQAITYLELTDPHAADVLRSWHEEACREFGLAPSPS